MAGGGGSSGRWLVTYADLITLLMVLFLLLFSSSQIQKEKLIAISEAMRRALNKDADIGSSTGAALLSTPNRERITSASEAIEEAAKTLGIDKSVSFSTDERGTVISIVDAVFFDPGSADIKSNIMPLLREVAAFCKETGSEIRVEGHTDNQPIENNVKIRSNWQLSALRATNVVEFFIRTVGFDGRKIGAVAFGDSRPLVPNTTAYNRGRNRRIEIVLLTTEVIQKRDPRKSLTNLDLIERDIHQREEDMSKVLNVEPPKKK